MLTNLPTNILIDATNYNQYLLTILEEIARPDYLALDIETWDTSNPTGKNKYINMRKNIITGISIYPEDSKVCFYFNLNHADVENRISWEQMKAVLDAKKPEAAFVCHNAVFEIVNLKHCYDYDLRDSKCYCTMVLSVSHHGADNYKEADFNNLNISKLRPFFKDIEIAFSNYDPFGGRDLTTQQQDLLGKFIGKQSRASYSYNGMINSISYTHGLKKLVKVIFNHDMVTFKESLRGKAHMGELTGAEVLDYGAADSVLCLYLFKYFLKNMSPQLINTYLNQENPMIDIYSNIKLNGVRCNLPAVKQARERELDNAREILIQLKEHIGKALPFPTELHKTLTKDAKWYAKNYQKYRQQLIDYVNLPEDIDIITQIKGGIRKAIDPDAKTGLINLSHYMPMQTLLYDLLRLKVHKVDKKVTTDKETRGKLLEKAEGQAKEILQLLNELSRIEQVLKLFITPYLTLTDTDTKRLYPECSSTLVTRRISMSNPNTQQLSKRGGSAYVRGFFQADDDDSVIIAADWSSIELVIPGEFSLDPYFLDCFGQLPYKDLHAITTAEMLDLTLEEFNELGTLPEDTTEYKHLKLTANDGTALTPYKYKSFMRTTIGKGSNFSYAFSGYLSGTGKVMGWSSDEMYKRTEKYRNKFSLFEKWRVNTIEQGCLKGYTELPDFHRRERFEATAKWKRLMETKFNRYEYDGLTKFGNLALRKIQSRAKNQLVNAKVQGTAAALLKRTILMLEKEFASWEGVRFMLGIHDEVVWSVPRNLVAKFIPKLREIMNHPKGLFKTCVLNCTVSMGRTLEPFDVKKAPTGQFELDEANKCDWLEPDRWGKELNEDEIQTVIERMFE